MINLDARIHGNKYRLEIYTAAMQHAGWEFAKTKIKARNRKKELKALGFTISIFEIGPQGSLTLFK